MRRDEEVTAVYKQIIVLPAILAALALTGCGSPQSAQSTAQSTTSPTNPTGASSTMSIAKAESVKTLAISNDTFNHVVDVVHVGDVITWTNDDSVEHKLTTYPNTPHSFTLDIQPHASGSHKFTKAGVYRYYGSKFAVYNSKMKDVEASKQAKAYPVPMRGVVIVLPESNRLPASTSAAVDIPNSTMTFTPWALTVNVGTTVKWTNHDDMTHVVAPVPGHVTAQFNTLTLTGDTGNGQLTFTKPGVYYYYCPVHANWNGGTQQLVPLKSYGSYPFVMDGLIIVTPKAH